MDMNILINIEKAILSTILYNPIVIQELSDIIRYEDFIMPIHQNIFKEMVKLNLEELPIDEEFIRHRIKSEDVDLSLINILSANPITNYSAYASEIIEASKKRKINKTIMEIKNDLSQDDLSVADLLYKLNKDIEEIENISNIKEISSKEILNQLIYDMEKAALNEKPLGQISGLLSLDKIIGVFEDGDLIVIAARPSMGKTSIISAITNRALEDGNGVLIESLEMPAKKIMARLIAARSGENLSDIKKGFIKDKDKFQEAYKFFACENLIINDSTSPTIFQLQNRIKKVLRKNSNIKNIFIDHTGKIQLEGKTREDIEIGQITNALKKIARDYNIRVFLLQQLNRSVESRDNKRPMLSDLKNSGNIEEDADMVLGLYRDSYYKSKEKAFLESPIENAEIIVLKNRDGETRTAKVAFEGRCARFINRIETNIPVKIEFEG